MLRMLKIECHKLDDNFLARFSTIAFDSRLYLRGWAITNVSLEALGCFASSILVLDIGNTNCPAGSFYHIVENCKNLEELVCSFDMMNSGDYFCHLEKLKKLGIVIYQNQNLGDFFNGLSLTCFSLKISRGVQLESHFVPSFIQRISSMPRLNFLSLEKLNLQGDEFKALLQTCPMITELEIIEGRLASPPALDETSSETDNGPDSSSFPLRARKNKRTILT